MSSFSSSYSPRIDPGAFMVTSGNGGSQGGFAVARNLVYDFWGQWPTLSTSTGGVGSWYGPGFLGTTPGTGCTYCDYCLCPQCEWCLPQKSPAYVTVALSGWVCDLPDIQIIGDPNQTWDLGIPDIPAIYSPSMPGVIPRPAGGYDLQTTWQQAGFCTFSRSWQCNKPFYVQVNDGTSSSAEWVNLFQTDDETILTLIVTYGASVANQEDGTAGAQPGPVVSVSWLLTVPPANGGSNSYSFCLGTATFSVCTPGTAPGTPGCKRCNTPCCTDALPAAIDDGGIADGSAATKSVTRFDCSQTFTATVQTVQGDVPSSEGGYDNTFANVFTAGAANVTGSLTFPTTWFPLTNFCPASESSIPTTSASVTEPVYSWSSSSGASQSTSYLESSGGTIWIIPSIGSQTIPGPGTGGPGPGPGGGSSSGASSGAPSSLTTVDCTDNTTPGPLVPFYGGPGPGTFFKWTDGNCYRVQFTTSQSAPTYAPTETYDTCEACTISDQYIQLTPCGSGTANYWTYVPTWIASGKSVYFDGTNCYIVNAGNTRTSAAGVGAAGGTIVPTPTLDNCSDSRCSCNCASLPASLTVNWVDSNPTPNVPYTATVVQNSSGSCSYHYAGGGSPAIMTLTIVGAGTPCQWTFSVNGNPGATMTGGSPIGSYPPDGAGNISISVSS